MSYVLRTIAPLLEATKYHPTVLQHISKQGRAKAFEAAADRIWVHQTTLDCMLNPLKSSNLLASNEFIVKPYIEEVAKFGVHLVFFREGVKKEIEGFGDIEGNRDIAQYYKKPVFNLKGNNIKDMMLKDLAKWSLEHKFKLEPVPVMLEYFHKCYVEYLGVLEERFTPCK